MKDPDIRTMSRADLEDEVMLLRAQIKVLQNEQHKYLHLWQKCRAELADATVTCCDYPRN